MTDLYEFGVRGQVGPDLGMCLPELELVADTPSTVLSGTVPGPAGLQRILDVLSKNGLAAVDVRLTDAEGSPQPHVPRPTTEQDSERLSS